MSDAVTKIPETAFQQGSGDWHTFEAWSDEVPVRLVVDGIAQWSTPVVEAP